MRLHVRRSAERAADRGSVVFLHGFPFDGSIWEPQLLALPDGWRGLAPDLRGFGLSPLNDPAVPLPDGRHTASSVALDAETVLPMATLADDAAALIEREDAAPAVVCGLSMGGYVAFELWRRRPDLFRALVLVDTRAHGDGDEARENRRRSAQTARTAGADAIARASLPDLLSRRTRDDQPDVVDRVRAMITGTETRTLIAALAGMALRHDFTAELRALDLPTLVVNGRDDAIIPTTAAEEMAASIPGARLEIVDGAGHLPNIERPDAFNHILRDFLASLPAS